MEVKHFINHTSDPFSWAWDKELHSFEPGESKWLPDFLANHLAKHLTNKILNKMGDKDSKYVTYVGNPDNPIYAEMFKKCFLSTEPTENTMSAEIEIANKNAEVSSDIESKKKVSKKKNKQPEEEFEGLEETK
jgi:hypothetical protein